ncbi:tRNA nucleotidyltransferase [Pyrobaculum aerophilum str. IM2]|uniref:CCA-adding enzyme n=2 Tax=Pyrobaculum aerophilum TaxID=13773 RepID=CCA_PYRAE|nr:MULTISPECIES: CCA tRNA nucleotidyltransferase [Pyrobaculum]Q8ZTC3.1 RecName: Full=CCA-adding enzyme; AltName: Full=CCA tRNA nucleotidyltransferase; AltName: Full=tRNA CCA-pyrophosphorylase; AltName: Full=tRNA adenylyl-/cytidylyl- transferase; AltName: Full=tRNA nucleotidyltransferase; AltName: Full=tRNA-NT [Pyrobaculum aerophilum str. IM2]AAL64839.1 tRNA nucleotidyltransferase [Pyrobaculum aerophilum str. IM2]HII47550.1 CCA tRNA nucleotidyltransferase [Pyrobaculum aerophilum]
MSTLEEVLSEAYKLVIPSEEEEKRIREVTQKVKRLVSQIIEEGGIDALVDVYGSGARGTWLPGQRDIDIFVVLNDRRIKPEDVVKILTSRFTTLGLNWALRYAQHPYVSLQVDDYEVDIVPCYKIQPGERPITAADRSPLHHKFLSERLKKDQILDVRLLKLFLKTIGVYGAEIKTEGFSGYLTELLVVYYGSFIEVLRAASRWRPYKTYITFVETSAKFKSPLVVVDPVDPNRNAAAAVSLTSMSTLILAARRFLKKPSLSYFQPSRGYAIRQVETVEVVYPYPGEPPDIVWGKYKRIGRNLFKWLRECGFKVFRWGVESDEKTYVKLVYVVEQTKLAPYTLHKGPPVYDDAVDAFIEKYVNEEVIGPFVVGARAYVIKKRKWTDISHCINAKLGKGNYDIRVNLYDGDLVRKTPWLT